MRDLNARVVAVIPAFNEEASISLVLNDLKNLPLAKTIVVNNGSFDATAKVARQMGAHVVHEPRRGYGQACLTGIYEITRLVSAGQFETPEIVVFLDADYSDHPLELPLLTDPIQKNQVDFTLGSRFLGRSEKGSLLPQAVIGNRVATFLIRLLFGHRYTDLGPFRAISYTSLLSLGMNDRAFGWTVEMQVRALLNGLRVMEVPISYRKRIGVSKITGTFSGTLRAGTKIISTIFGYASNPFFNEPRAFMKRVIVFAKAPVPGQVKTRMAPELTPEQSAALMEALTRSTLQTLSSVQDGFDGLVLSCSPNDEHPFFKTLASEFSLQTQNQRTGHLGERMAHVVDVHLVQDDDRVFLLGCDAPDIDVQILHEALSTSKDVVVGPSRDGGYYLLGLSSKVWHHCPEVKKIFGDLSWGSDQVFNETKEILRIAKIDWHELPFWTDIDRFDDLAFFEVQRKAVLKHGGKRIAMDDYIDNF